MPVTSTNAYSGPFTVSGTDPVSFDFQAASADEILVTLDGAELSSDAYTVELNGDDTGTVTPTGAWSGEVYVYSNPDFRQNAAWGRFEPYFPDQLVPPLDRLTKQQLALKDRIDRAPVAPVDGSAAGRFPVAAEDGGFEFTSGVPLDTPGSVGATEISNDPAQQLGIFDKLKAVIDAVGAYVRDLKDIISDQKSLLNFIPPSLHPAIKNYTSTVDHTAYIQAAVDSGHRIYAPPGRYNINATVGVKLKTRSSIVGAGYLSTVFWVTGGGTAGEIINYLRGFAFGRSFSLSTSNHYIQGVVLKDFAVILNHPTNSITSTNIQVGIDGRNITRSLIDGVYIGNVIPEQFPIAKTRVDGFDQQGYGILLGTLSGGTSYAGGEGNTIRDCLVWGAYKAVSQDDFTLAPLSSAHATKIDGLDVQLCHEGLVQESVYATGCIYRNLTIQYFVKQNGNANPSHALLVSGYNNKISGTYIEAGEDCDYIIDTASGSRNNQISLTYYDALDLGQIRDQGANNSIRIFENNGTGTQVRANGVPIELRNNAYEKIKAKFKWNGSAIVIESSVGVASITHNGIGDYTVGFKKNMPNDDYIPSILLDTGPSGLGGTVSVDSASTSVGSIRFYTYAESGAGSSQIDPRWIYLRIEQ